MLLQVGLWPAISLRPPSARVGHLATGSGFFLRGFRVRAFGKASVYPRLNLAPVPAGMPAKLGGALEYALAHPRIKRRSIGADELAYLADPDRFAFVLHLDFSKSGDVCAGGHDFSLRRLSASRNVGARDPMSRKCRIITSPAPVKAAP